MIGRASATDALDDGGETLIEIIISILVMSIVFVALMAGFGTSIGISAIHKQQSAAQTIARDLGEYMQYYVSSPPSGVQYQDCGTPASYAGALNDFRSTYKLPDGTTPLAGATPTFTVAVSGVSYWDGNISPANFVSGCTVDKGTQRIDLVVTSVKDTSLVQKLQVVKRK